MKILAPTHPLIHAFLLREKRLDSVKNIIVESEAYAEKLAEHMTSLGEKMWTASHAPVIIKTNNDILRVSHYDNTGIYSTSIALDPPPVSSERMPYTLKKWESHKERDLLEWLDNNGFTADSTREMNTYFRQWDTITIMTSQGVLQVSFLWNTIEDMYLDQIPQASFILIGL